MRTFVYQRLKSFRDSEGMSIIEMESAILPWPDDVTLGEMIIRAFVWNNGNISMQTLVKDYVETWPEDKTDWMSVVDSLLAQSLLLHQKHASDQSGDKSDDVVFPDFESSVIPPSAPTLRMDIKL